MMTECKYCKKTFNHSGHLTRHIRTHTREKPYECRYCKKRFSDSSTLTVHTRIHTGERPFSCKFCKKTFSRSDSLRVHVRTHTGEKKFECHHCRKTFSRSGNLTVHLRTHMSSLGANDPCNIGTANGTFECHRCNKSFTQVHDLNRHLKTHYNHGERVENPLFQAICKTEATDVRSKPSCCGNNFQPHSYPSTNGNLCCKTSNMPFGFDQCSTTNKMPNYINGQPLNNGTITANLEGNKDQPLSVSGHHINRHRNLQSNNGHYTQLLVQNENKPFDCHGFEKSVSHTCQLQRHLQRSLDAGVDSVMAAPPSCDNQNILYMNTGFHGHTAGDKSRRCTLCEKSVYHMCQLNGDNYCIPFSGSYNSLTNVTNMPANPMCSNATDFNRNQACTYIDSRSLPTQQHFGCNHCKNPSHTNSLNEVKPTAFGSQIYIKPDVNSNSSTEPLQNSCAYLNGKSHNGESQFGCENCKTGNHTKEDKNAMTSLSSSSSQNENDKKQACPTNSTSNQLQNQSCSYAGNNHQLFGCKRCDVRGFGQPFTMNYANQHEIDIKPNLPIGNLDPNLQSNHYYSNIRTNPSDKQLSCLKPYSQNPADRKADLSGSNPAHPSNSFYGLLQSLPEPDIFECDNNNTEKSYVPLGGFLNPQTSTQKSCLFSSLSCNNSEMLDIKPNISSLHDHYHQALTHFSQADAFSKSDFSACFSTAQTTLEPNLYDVNSAGMGGNVNMGGVTSGTPGMCMKSEPFFCSSGDNQTQPFSYHSIEQPDIKPDLSLLWF